MLRLKSPVHERFFQSSMLEATFGGGEANVCGSLALLGRSVRYLTALPKHAMADALIGWQLPQVVRAQHVTRDAERVRFFHWRLFHAHSPDAGTLAPKK